MTAPFVTAKALYLPQISHGFFGRQGGVSEGLYDSLNAGFGAEDDAANVAKNQSRISAALGAKHLVTNHQIHSADVVTVTAQTDLTARIKADGLVTTLPNIALSALHADCAPVLFADVKAGVIGACHAGWRGAVTGVTDSTILAMAELGATLDNIIAAVGPCISGENYEVGQAFKDQAIAINSDTADFFETPSSGKPHFNLPAYVRYRLARAGVSVDGAPSPCTYAQPDTYFSYRYNTHQGHSDYGRNLSAIMLRG